MDEDSGCELSCNKPKLDYFLCCNICGYVDVNGWIKIYEHMFQISYALKGRNKTRFLLPHSFEQNTPSLNQGKTLAATTATGRSRVCRRLSQSEDCLLESSCVTVRGVLEVFDLFAVTSRTCTASSLSSTAVVLSLLFVAIYRSQGFVSKEWLFEEFLFVLLALSKSNPLFAVFFLAWRPSSIGFILLAIVLSPSPSRSVYSLPWKTDGAFCIKQWISGLLPTLGILANELDADHLVDFIHRL
ncbi:uncharacterized protein [Arachis hypogaea]|uniref:uncharacterized protein n=1 Tax=Arachis hypogaea TaxID=3818 RepID=UPI003B227E17